VGSTIEAAPNIRQELFHVSDSEKYPKLLEQLAAHKGSAIIFVKTKYGADKLSDKLSRQNHKSDAIHGNLRQSRRDRVIQSFRDRQFRVLVATDLAARGLDVPHIELVINYDMPQCPEDYIHRIGRTARAGASGKAVNFLTPGDREKWNAIHRLMNPGAPRVHEPRSEGRGQGPRSQDARGRGPRSQEPRSHEARSHEGRSQDVRPHEGRGGQESRSGRPHQHRNGSGHSSGSAHGGANSGGGNGAGHNGGRRSFGGKRSGGHAKVA
jgi:superfamily II DNA/RNA helicase